MIFNRDYRLHSDVLWIFRRKAKLRGVRRTNPTDEILYSLEKLGYQVNRIFSGKQYEPHAVFVNGTKYIQSENVVEIGKLLNEGMRTSKIVLELSVTPEKITRVRKAIERTSGRIFMCRCGLLISHGGTCRSLPKEEKICH